jgi:hypothetical protein
MMNDVAEGQVGRFVRDSAYFAAALYRTLTYHAAKAEQTWSKHHGDHMSRRLIRSVVLAASGAPC